MGRSHCSTSQPVAATHSRPYVVHQRWLNAFDRSRPAAARPSASRASRVGIDEQTSPAADATPTRQCRCPDRPSFLRGFLRVDLGAGGARDGEDVAAVAQDQSLRWRIGMTFQGLPLFKMTSTPIGRRFCLNM